MQRGTEHSLFLQGTYFFLAQRTGLKPGFHKTQKHTINGGPAQELLLKWSVAFLGRKCT